MPGLHRKTRPTSCTFLSGVRAKATEGSDYEMGVTVDQIAAQQLGKDTALSSLELATDFNYVVGNCDNGFNCVYMNTLAWSSKTPPLPTEANPRVVFDPQVLALQADITRVITFQLAREVSQDRSRSWCGPRRHRAASGWRVQRARAGGRERSLRARGSVARRRCGRERPSDAASDRRRHRAQLHRRHPLLHGGGRRDAVSRGRRGRTARGARSGDACGRARQRRQYRGQERQHGHARRGVQAVA